MEPQSHYSKLSLEQKKAIRPLVFMELPGEIRNHIYEYLVTIPEPRNWEGTPEANIVDPKVGRGRFSLRSCRSSLRPWLHFSQEPRPDCGRPSLVILRTCKQIHEEATPMFYDRNILELEIHPVRYVTNPDLTDLPYNIKLVKNCRILVTIRHNDDVDGPVPGQCFGLLMGDFYSRMTSLQSLQIAIRWHRCRLDSLVCFWLPTAASIACTNMVVNMVHGVPKGVQIKWGSWPEIQLPKNQRDHIEVNGTTLEGLGKSYLRKSKLRRRK